MALATSRFDNLSTILSVAGMLVILGFTGQLSRNMVAQAERMAPTQSAQGYTRPPVQGYQRPPVQGYSRPPKFDKNLNSLKHSRSDDLDAPQLPIPALSDAQNAELIKRFQEAAVMLHAKKYRFAITALDEVLRIVPNMPEAYVNMGYALFGLQRYDEADQAFNKAIELRPYQANAYYGLASVLDAKKDYEAALGAMRSFIHLSPPDTDQRFIAKARAAIWEWQGLLGRIPGVKAAPPGTRPQIDEYIGGSHVPEKRTAASATK